VAILKAAEGLTLNTTSPHMHLPRNDAMLMACWPGKVVAGFDKTSDAELRRRLEDARPQDPTVCQTDLA